MATNSALEAHIKHKSTMILAGPSGSGKTNFIIQLLRNRHKIVPSPEVIIYCYGVWQTAYEEIQREMPDVLFVKGLVSTEKLNTEKRHLLIMDDLINHVDMGALSDIFTRESHHRNISAIFVTQNMFLQGKNTRTISLNTKYFVIFNSPRDKRQIQCLAYQMFTNKKEIEYFMSAYRQATEKPYGYLFIDLTQDTPSDCRLRTDIFSDREIIYIKD
jgi:GTPase SAR1 family protein